MAFVTRMSILQELPRAVQNISQLLEKFFEKAEQENYPNAAFARRTARSRQVPHIALKQRRRTSVRKPKAERQDGMHDGFAAAIKNAVRRTAFNTMAGPPGFEPGLRAPKTPVLPLHHGPVRKRRAEPVLEKSVVGREGIEPAALGLKVPCSTS